KSACKDLSRNGQRPAITSEAAYTPVPNRAGSRSHKKSQKDMTCGAHKSYLSGFA
ncbi:ATP-dependent nuclease subunit B, partial [Lacticaseibacillus rhamnosus]|nr:ATP-dependent nuclease subunit B [Lacticaseibacillus rhamnosus]